MKFYILNFLLISIFFLACKEQEKAAEEIPMSRKDIYNKTKSGVVYIYSSYIFESTLDNNSQIYFTLDEEGLPNIYSDYQEAISNAHGSSGTGFFITEHGEIATNRHVAYPQSDIEYINNLMISYLEYRNTSLHEYLSNTNLSRDELSEKYVDRFDDLNEVERQSIIDSLLFLSNELKELEEIVENIDFTPEKTTSRVILGDLKIAYEDTYVTDTDDMYDCIIKAVSQEPEIDLAIIQLKDKITPHDKFVFDIDSLTTQPLDLGDDVYMIGYNKGLSIAKTKQGIKTQFTTGNISQESDGNRIMYTIPTLPGSSGSPVLNAKGDIVAVNYAGWSDTQGFNYGISIKHLKELFKSL